MLLLALLPAAPLVRVFVGPIPIYLCDLLLVVLAAVFLRPSRLGPRERQLLAMGAWCLSATLPSLLVALLSYDTPLFTLYYYGRRVLAFASFGTFVVLFARQAALRRTALRALLAGTVVLSVWCLAEVLTRGTGLVGALDHLYYDRLFQVGRELAVDSWQAVWKTPRAVAGWWNANVTGAALTLCLATIPAVASGGLALGATIGVWIALFATASRQALIGAALLTAFALSTPGRGRGVAVTAGLAGLLLAAVFAGEQVARVSGLVDGGLDEGFASRWNNYPDFFAALAASTPLTFLVGRGAESWTAVSRAGVALDSSGFVSNVLLLTLAENGLLGLAGLVAMLATVARRAVTRWQQAAVLLVVWLLNCDNHLYLSPSLIALMAMVLALAATPPGPRMVASRSAAR